MAGSCFSGSFKALIAAQFLGAVNDNLFKVVLTLIIANLLLGNEASSLQLILTNVLFVLPYLLFSPLAGSLADRYRKHAVLQASKLLEVLVMGLAFYLFLEGEVRSLLVVLFFMGLQSALFSPAKYGVLPEILPHDRLSQGNGYLEFWSFAGILSGTALSGLLLFVFPGSFAAPGGVLFFLAIVGFVFSCFISGTKPGDPSVKLCFNPLATFSSLAQIRKDRELFLAVLAISFFWSLGALYQLNLVMYAKELAELDDFYTSLWLLCLGVGIGLGSIGAGFVSQGKVEIGLVPIGSLGIAVSSGFLAFVPGHYTAVCFLLLLLGISSGVFVVPLNSFLQARSPENLRGSFIAASNVISFFGVLCFSFFLLFLLDVLRFDPAVVFFICALLAAGVAVWGMIEVPRMTIRCLNWLLVHSVYRLQIRGIDNIPQSGGALLVCNHVSYVDAPLLLAAAERPISFIMHKPIYESPLIRPVAKAMQTIPIASGSKEEILAALDAAKEAIRGGELVGIFPEGGISRIGRMLKFKRGLERIMEGLDAPIIPVHLDQLWGSIFSRRGGRFFWKWPRVVPYPVTVSFGSPLPANSNAFVVRKAVQELSSSAFSSRGEAFQVLHRSFVKAARRNPFRPCVADSSGVSMSYWKTLSASLTVSSWLKQRLGEEKMVGVHLPPSVAAVLTNIALLFCGRVPVNLNYTASEESLAAAVRRCGIKAVVSAEKVLEKLPLKLGEGMVEVLHVENARKDLSKWKIVGSFLSVLFLPEFLLSAWYSDKRTRPSDLATVIFSSGSTGEPKGVMLSHANISSNITASFEIFEMKEDDALLGVLPFFHSFGFMATMWLPLLAGARAVYHYNPLQAGVIGKLAKETGATILMATPTFLRSYLKKVEVEQFKKLRCVLVGAEKLKPALQEAFFQKFGVVPREGYGCTELSPIALGNVEDFREGRSVQIGAKTGSAGHPIPGVAVKIVDPETFKPRSLGEEGLLLVKGPNVMQGYLGEPQRTAEVMRDGWYVTGDIALEDEDGFVMITDRLSRFSKIAGEMVPHVRVEDEIHAVLGVDDPVCAVAGVPDSEKGERLVVLASSPLDVPLLIRQLSERGLPNLWIPKKEDFFQVDELPLLGSGKLDLKEVKRLAIEKAAV